ncbi:unnamed protein product [Ceratitis capitata]|uniref:(Mediterranean fruit fly) hypothetical protein n=1 Tax=Ceratitis capitata TaxID=7213 RepID=A0A811UPL4_CERCA|nr:unnamed protein product [Ceratitis capitata]
MNHGENNEMMESFNASRTLIMGTMMSSNMACHRCPRFRYLLRFRHKGYPRIASSHQSTSCSAQHTRSSRQQNPATANLQEITATLNECCTNIESALKDFSENDKKKQKALLQCAKQARC